ncbi:hypothetical protein [Pseudomonas sp. NPDC089569]|uniref:hypothetical protein n=1 Tax=Pseudomonas sp. NPDC089569 TaxID=3390722 RepID=UPI003CFFBCE7
MAYEDPAGKTRPELETLLRRVYNEYPEYNNSEYGSGRFEDMVDRFAEDAFYKLHFVAKAFLETPRTSHVRHQKDQS